MSLDGIKIGKTECLLGTIVRFGLYSNVFRANYLYDMFIYMCIYIVFLLINVHS